MAIAAYLMLAGAMRVWARRQEPGTVLPPNIEFAIVLDEVVGRTPYNRAKHVLVGEGVLRKDGRYFVVASQTLQTPLGSASGLGDGQVGHEQEKGGLPIPDKSCL